MGWLFQVTFMKTKSGQLTRIKYIFRYDIRYFGCHKIIEKLCLDKIENKSKRMKIDQIQESSLAKDIEFDPNSNKSTLISLLEKQLMAEMTEFIRSELEKNREESVKIEADIKTKAEYVSEAQLEISKITHELGKVQKDKNINTKCYYKIENIG
ncbi:hypothetical protein C1645_744114 [Glomus cerebriforme]|uniref:Uncharacterized protein n=1 Tax=Glomus cerebriforme TaxID=658196 RepID=A0A397S909_9GLOM|nr:hypothetical protein C1645_744114 [Glomus cerebriforme]